jgi:hypothetical protein
MNIFSSTLIQQAVSADIVEEKSDGTIYMAWLKPGEDETSTEARICKIEKSGTTDITYSTKWANGSKDFAFDWSNRASLNYYFKK